MSKGQEESYDTLKPKLVKILELLEETTPVVNVRDECSFQATTVNLGMPMNSRLLRRRTMPIISV